MLIGKDLQKESTMRSKEEGWAMETKPVVTRFPLCRHYGLVSYPKGEPRVLSRDLKTILLPGDYQKWLEWSNGITFDSLGFYAWDVEAFLSGQPNND